VNNSATPTWTKHGSHKTMANLWLWFTELVCSHGAVAPRKSIIIKTYVAILSIFAAACVINDISTGAW